LKTQIDHGKKEDMDVKSAIYEKMNI